MRVTRMVPPATPLSAPRDRPGNEYGSPAPPADSEALPLQGELPAHSSAITHIHAGRPGIPLQDVIDAVRRISETLADLKKRSGVAHRDINPGNLYELDGQWLIGDL